MSKRNQKRSEIWDIFRHNETPPPTLPPQVLQSSKAQFLPAIQKPSRESLQTEDTPKLISKFEDLPNLEIRGRLRELEIQMMDLRVGVERRLSSVSEDFPNRLNKELRIIQERDSYMWKENTQKQIQLNDSLRLMQDSLRGSIEALNNELVVIRRKVDEVTVKHSNTVREIDLLGRVPRQIEAQPAMDFSPLVASFREALNEEKRKREQMQQEYNSQIQELHLLVRTSYTEHGKRLQEYRDQVLSANVEVRNQIVGVESGKEERIKNESEYLKAVFTNLQKRLEDEVNQRSVMEKEHKMWTDSRLNQIQKIMKNEEKETADRESKVLAMVQEGLAALHEIITRVKETSSASLTKVQTMTNENLKDLAQALSGIKDGLYSRIENLEFSLQEEIKFRSEGISSVHMHIQKTTEAVDRQGLFLENQIMSSENRIKALVFDIEQQNIARDEKLNQWQLLFNENLENHVSQVAERLNKSDKEWELRHKDAQETNDKTASHLSKARTELEASLEQVKNTINFEDGLIEQKVTNAVNLINDKIDRELIQVKNKMEKELANTNADLFESLALRVEQTIKLSQEQIKSAVAEEAKIRKAEVEAAETLARQLMDQIYSKSSNELNREVIELNEKMAQMHSEDQSLRTELNRVRIETANSLESLFGSIDEAKENLRQWAERYTNDLIDSTKKDVNTLVDVEREVLLKEIDKAKTEFSAGLQELSAALQHGSDLESKLERRLLAEIKDEKDARIEGGKELDSRLTALTSSMQEAINQSAEAVKAVSRALILKESAERNQGLESIMKSLQSRIAALEDLLKFYTSKTAEELRSEFSELVEKERSARQANELAQVQSNKKLKSQIKDHKAEQEVALALSALIDSVVQKATHEKIEKQKEEIETAQRKWVQNFERDLEDLGENIDKKEANLAKKILKSEKNLVKKIEIKNLLDDMIGLIENDDTNRGIKESQNNIEILFNNMKKLELFLSDNKDTLNEAILELERREAMNNEEKRERIEMLREKVESLEGADLQKTIDLLMDQVELMRQENLKKQQEIDEIQLRQDELNNQQVEFVRIKSERDQELQEALKILAESNAKIDQNISDVQTKFPQILDQLEKHEEQLFNIISSKDS